MERPFVLVTSDSLQGSSKAELGTPVGKGGMFARWSAEPGSLVAESDPFGLYPLFHANVPNGVALASTPVQLLSLGVPYELDCEALAVFHLLGFFLGNDTPFKGIKALNGRLEWRNGTTTLRAPERPIAQAPKSMAEAIERHAALFSSAMEDCARALTHPVILPLSGGRDSRHIGLELHRLGIPFRSVSFNKTPGGYDPDAAIGAEVARALGAEHTELTGSSRFRDQLATHRLTQLLSDEHFQMMPVVRFLRTGNYSIFDGLAGDSLSRNGACSDPVISAAVRAGKMREVADRLIAKRDGMDGSTFHDRTHAMPELRSLESVARERIAAAADMWRGSADPYADFWFFYRTRREVALMSGMMFQTSQAFVPYVSPDLVAHCLSLPEEFTQDGKFHDRVIAHSYPDFTISYANVFDTRWLMQRPAQKARMAAEALIESMRLGARGFLSEPAHLVRAATNPKAANLYVWSAYRSSLEAVSSPSKARRFSAA